eukprot:gene15566-6831_t
MEESGVLGSDDVDGSMEMNEESSDSSDSDESNNRYDEEIQNLQESVTANPFQYDGHISLIKALRLSGDLDATRKARECMSEIFPLTEELWLEWINDEKPLASLPAQRNYMESLLQKAVKDYQSVRVWIEYCQVAMDGIQSANGIDNVRKLYEKAVTAVGLHLTEGSSVWDSYREFEMEILQSYQQLHGIENAGTSLQRIEEQIARVEVLFKRQLAVPLFGMEQTMQEYEDWTSNPIPDTVDKAYQKALAKLEKCMPLEDALSKALKPKLAEYRDYIALEMKDGDPARVQCIYERAIKDNCLDPSLWIEYTEYLDKKLKVASVALPVHERATRNCPWVGKLWVNYIKAMEKENREPSDVKVVFQKALTCGFSSGSAYTELWLTYSDYMKRQITSWDTDEGKIKDLRETFENAVNYMDHYFGTDGDKLSLLRRYWAAIEAKYLNNLRKAQEIWDSVMKIHGKETHMWLEYTHFLRLHGDLVSCRRVFQRAVQTTVDDTEKLCGAFVCFEREEGTFEQLESAIERTENQLKKVENRRQKETEFDASKVAEREQKQERQKQAKLQKNKQNRKLGKQQKLTDESSLKKNAFPKRKLPISTGGKDEPPTKKAKEASRHDGGPADQNKVEAKTDDNFIEDKSLIKRASEDAKDRTVFLSNLLFSVGEKDIEEKFQQCGEIADIRISRNFMGRSKGFAYLEFKDKVSCEKALQQDRALLNGRPVFVSPCLDKEANKQPQFKYALTVDKHTVFVTNIPFDVTKEELEQIFNKVGEIKEIRIVTNRAGKPKGYAYIEYLDETSASGAVLKLDGHTIKERQIFVAISKAPSREEKAKQRTDQNKQPIPGSRGRAKTQLALVPRSIHTHATQQPGTNQQPKQSQTQPGTSESTQPKEAAGKLSNDDFRKLLGK